jgi:hypothetical protein
MYYSLSFFISSIRLLVSGLGQLLSLSSCSLFLHSSPNALQSSLSSLIIYTYLDFASSSLSLISHPLHSRFPLILTSFTLLFSAFSLVYPTYLYLSLYTRCFVTSISSLFTPYKFLCLIILSLL